MTTRVLLVDDDEAIRETVSLMLRDRGYEVVTAFDGLDALERMHTGWRPSVIVLDWQMPRMCGAEFLRERRLLPQLVGVPVLIVSASLSGSTVVSQREGLPVIRKPFDIEDLLATIHRLIGDEPALRVHA